MVEMGHALAGPLAATFLGDFGADVVKVERIDGGDSLRRMGPAHEGTGVWWSVTGRNKRSVCVDYKHPDGLAVLLDLIGRADVVIENFRAGALDRAGLGWDDLSATNPRLIMLRISGFGQTGPYSDRGGFGKIAEAFSGATYLTGEKEKPPLHPGYSLGDASTGLMGAFGVLLALQQRHASGRGQLIDLALYEPLLRLIEWQVPLHAMLGELASRNGTRFPFDGAFITDICATADGESVVVSAATSESLERLRTFVASVGELPDGYDGDDGKVVDGLRRWVIGQSRAVALERLQAEGLVVGAVFSAADIAQDPHIAARGNLIEVPNPQGVPVPMPAVLPTLSDSPGSVRRRAPQLGEHTHEVLTGDLGISEERYAQLLESGAIG